MTCSAIGKLSGGGLAGDKGFGISPPMIEGAAAQIRDVIRLGVQVGIVIGGGNALRGLGASHIGMLATIISVRSRTASSRLTRPRAS